ncbi:E4 SUMO-protein ligase PIAL2 [Capsella rubella]|uniref:E4 SUMO-protein ligase PIAL2 n=1 Tax=Capsella rubella TaxID=81985 RepID=UPI000CD56FE6|nr:E4 SUMO-protein ligase PIAL2 [Capsella rubella]
MSTVAGAATRPVSGSGLREKTAASLVNSFRLTSVTQRLRYHIQVGPKSDSKEFQICCISFAKGIDFAIANNDVPKKVEEFPRLLKQVCRHLTDVYTKTAVMVLMISVKHACQLGWFSDSESQELLALADEMRTCFGSSGSTIPGITSPSSTFSQIMERFYPFVKLGHVLVSFEVKAGYTMLAHDFHISKNMPHSLQEKIRLFVAQTDNIDTSSCISNPPEVSFLLNGKGVDKRVNIAMVPGPQLPTNVTAQLKYGTNLLQVMGNFKGNYIIIIAFTGLVVPPEQPVLKDYLQSGVIESSPDSDIIEGPSRVSLTCPISRRRIKLPVKGQLCKHLQCFDFSNYVHINMRNPSWRCPHCNQPVCYPEIRLDQNMVKILKDVGHNAVDVIIDAGGSWKVAKKTDEIMEPVREIIHDLEDPMSLLNSGPVVFDLTGDDDAEMEVFGNNKVEDQKPCLSNALGQSNNNRSKEASNDDNCSIFDLSDVIAFDPVILSALENTAPQPHQALNTGTGQQYSNLSQLPMSIDPMPVPLPFSQTPSPRDRPATTSTVCTMPSPQFSQVHASPVTPTGTYLGRTSSPRWNQTYPYQASSMTTPYQSRRVPIPGTSQSPANALSSVQSQHVPRVLNQPNSYGIRGVTSNHVSTQRQHQSGPNVQSVSRTSDLMDVDLTVPDTTNWRPRMRGSLVPGSHSTALDHMIIRPTQNSQTSTRPTSSQPFQTPSIQTSQSQSPFSTGAYRTQAVVGNRNHPVPAPAGLGNRNHPEPAPADFARPTGPTSSRRT